MNGYAPGENADDCAPLTSNLLARKGEAAPAFDSEAYSEVMTGNEFSAPLSPIFSNAEDYAANPGERPERLSVGRRSYDSAPMPASPAPSQQPGATNPPQSAPPTVAQPLTHRRLPRAAPVRFRAVRDGVNHASVTFRMTREELQRLRRAARKLDMNCLQILVDSVECYLDANEVEPVKNTWADE